MSSTLIYRCSIGHSVKELYRRRISTTRLTRAAKRQTKARPKDKNEIVIPARIKREPTDLLQAIAATVKKDFGSPAYKYIDDPEAIPTSSIAKKAYSLATASGKRAAQHVIKNYPEFFTDSPADPPIEAFMPPMSPTLAADTQDGLRERIDLRRVEDAYTSYNKCIEAGTELSEEIVCDLLDLLCVYNSRDPPDVLLSEEQEFSRLITQDTSRDKIRKTWQDDGAAENVFKSFENPPERAYHSMIRGRAKFFQVDTSVELFREMSVKGLKPDLQTYNAIIGLSGFVQNRAEEKLQFIKETLTSMQKDGLQPSLETFNRALVTASRSVRFHPPSVGRFVSSLLSEMMSCGIEPSLATWNHVLRVYYYNDDVQSEVLEEIINRLEGTDLKANHPDDLDFFSTAMVKCCVNLKDLELANRIDDLLNTGQNYKLIGDNFKEGLYYNFYLKVLCMFEQIDTIMEHFEKLVPHSFSPTFSALDDLFEALELNEGYEYLPKIWSDLHSFGYDRTLNIMETVARLMAKRKHPEQLQGQIFELICYHFDLILGEIDFLKEKDRFDQITMLPMVSAPLLSSMIQICLDSDDLTQANNMFSFYVENKAVIRGNFVEKNAVNLVNMYIKGKDLNMALEVLKVMSSFAHASIDVTVEKIKEEMDLSDEDRALVDDLL